MNNLLMHVPLFRPVPLSLPDISWAKSRVLWRCHSVRDAPTERRPPDDPQSRRFNGAGQLPGTYATRRDGGGACAPVGVAKAAPAKSAAYLTLPAACAPSTRLRWQLGSCRGLAGQP